MSNESDPDVSTGSNNSFFKLMGFVKKKPQLPDGWIVKQSSTYTDRVYFFNVRTGATTWNPPGLLASSETASQKSISDTASETTYLPSQTSKKRSISKSCSKSSNTNAASSVTLQNLSTTMLKKTKQQPSQTYSSKALNAETRNLHRKDGAQTLCELSQKSYSKTRVSLSRQDDRVNIQQFRDSKNEYKKKWNLDEKLTLNSPSPPWGIPLRRSNLGGTLTPESLTPRSLLSRGGPSDASSVSSLSSKLGSPTVTKKPPARKKRSREDTSSSDNQSKSKSKQLKATAIQKSPSETWKKEMPKKSLTNRNSGKEVTRTAVIQPQVPSKTDKKDLRLTLERSRHLKIVPQQPKPEEHASQASSPKVPPTLIPPKLPSNKPEAETSAKSIFLSKLKARRVERKQKDLPRAPASKKANESKASLPSRPLETVESTKPATAIATKEALPTTSYGCFNQAIPEGDDCQITEEGMEIDDGDGNAKETCGVQKLGLRIVLDTNALMHDLTFVKRLLDQCINGLGQPILVIPWVVMQELDGLKNGSNKGDSAWNAVQFLHKCFMSEHPRVQGEPLRKVYDEADFEITCNDDWILQCCLQHQKKVGKDLVVLLSNDKHLCSKAIISSIKAFGTEKLLSGLEDLAAILQHRSPLPPEPSELLRQQNNDPSVPVTHQARTPSPIEFPLPPTAERELCDQLVCSVKEALHHSLTIVVETEMIKAYDDLWTDIVVVKPPWSFQAVLQCFEKHWMAVFGFFLNKEDNRRLLQIMELTSASQVPLSNVKTLINSSIFFCRRLCQHNPYDKALEQPILKLGELKKRCQLPPPEGKKVPNQISLNEELAQTVPNYVSSFELIPSVFEVVWLKILQLSTLVFEGLGIPHDLETDKTVVIPSELECHACLNILCPLLQQLIEALESATEIPDSCIVENTVHFDRLCKTIHIFLNEFITGEQQRYSNLTTVALQNFIMVYDNRQLLRNGIIQLTSAFTKLAQCHSMSS